MGILRRVARRLGRALSEDRSASSMPVARTVPTVSPVAGSGIDSASLSRIECGVAELAERIGAGEKVTIVDVRQPEETAGGVLVGARLIPLGELSTRWKELEDCDEVVCYCASGMRSQTAARQLRDWGVLNATSLEGGISAWMQYGGEVVSP